MAAVSVFHTGKAVMEVAAIEIAIDHLHDVGPPESIRRSFTVRTTLSIRSLIYAGMWLLARRAALSNSFGFRFISTDPMNQSNDLIFQAVHCRNSDCIKHRF